MDILLVFRDLKRNYAAPEKVFESINLLTGFCKVRIELQLKDLHLDRNKMIANEGRKKGGEMGGFSLVETMTTGGPLVVLYSDQLQDCLQRVKTAGGTITKDIFEFPGGKRFEFTDQGRLAMYEQGQIVITNREPNGTSDIWLRR